MDIDNIPGTTLFSLPLLLRYTPPMPFAMLYCIHAKVNRTLRNHLIFFALSLIVSSFTKIPWSCVS